MSTLGLYFPMPRPEANELRAELNAIARQHGYLATRGPTAGQGNAAAMLVAIATGELAVLLLPDEQRAWFAEWLRAQAAQLRQQPDLRSWSLAEACETTAEALEQLTGRRESG